MASRHDIVSITFQANASKANVALQALQGEAKKSSDRVKDLKRQLEEGIKANMPTEQLQRIRDEIKQAERELKQWSSAYKGLIKGVQTLDEAVKQFNAGTMGQMNAAFNKAAANAAKLAQTKMTPGTREWKEMDALIVEAQSNVLKATADINGLVSAIQKGGKSSKSTLTQAKNDLQQLLTLEVRGSAEWNAYNKQLKAVEGELSKLSQVEQRAAQADRTAIMTKRMESLKTISASALAETKRYWEQMIAGADNGSVELAKYESNLKKVVNQERSRSAASTEQVLGNMNKYGIEQVRSAVQEMTRLRDTTQAGIPSWQHYNRLVKDGEAYLAQYAEREKIVRGESMSLADALKLSATAGGRGFEGSAKQLQMAEQSLQKSLSTAKKGSTEWKQYQEALSKVRVEMQNAGMTSERMHEILAKPTSSKNLNELQAAVKRAKAELNLMADTVGNNNKQYQELANQTKNAEIQMKQMQSAARGTASSFDKAWSRLKTYIGLYVGAAVAMQKLMAMMGDLMDLSDKMGEVRKTTGFTDDEVGHLTENLKKLDTRTSINGLLELSAAAGQLGLKSEQDVQGFTEAANKLMVALPEMGREGATQMLKVALATGEIDKIQRQMNEGTISGSSAVAVAMEKVGSTIDRLRASSASAAPAITDFVQRVGAVGAQSGISIDQTAALGSTVDALGMRVEMSATALSRMIPAIRANAFDVAHAIGVTPETLRNLFDTGRGMEAILMIFQHIKDSGMDANSIESMLGMGSMKEIMKELNQQGARAGIVFSGLSQNVDELRRQLGVASEAYEQNVAIQMEYDKMNETTAAKWERLKNQLEEAFVGDTAQRFLGSIIDGLRNLVDFITGNVNPALQILSILVKTFIAYWAVLKVGLGEGLFIKVAGTLSAMKDGLTNLISNTRQYILYSRLLKRAQDEQVVASIRARMAQEGLNKAMLANIWTAVAMAIMYACYKLYDWIQAQREGASEAARFEAELQKEQKKVDDLAYSIAESRVKIEGANKEVDKARIALNAAKNATDGTADSAKRLTDAETKLIAAEEEKKRLMAAHKQLIEQFNTEYGKYLGFMLSEVSSNLELARARELVNNKLRESITLKRKEAALERIEKEKGEDRDDEYADLYDYIEKFTINDPAKRARVMAQLVNAANRSNTEAEYKQNANKILTGNFGKYPKFLLEQSVDYFEEVDEIRQANQRIEEQFSGELAANREMSQISLVKQSNASIRNYRKLQKKYASSKGDARKQAAADLLKQLDTLNEISNNASSYFDFGNGKEAALYRRDFTNIFNPFVRNQNAFRKKLLKEAGNLYQSRTTLEGISGSGSNGHFSVSNRQTSHIPSTIWGSNAESTSTGYSTWDVNELVERRNQMDKFKNILKPDTNIRAVLAEDKALMKALDNGLKDDWKSVLGWYNQERLKIQKELKSERFSTNTGHWRDEKDKDGIRRRNPLYESDYALAELDRYYLRRQETLEKARGEEKISEEVFNRQTELLEQEHLERRAKLRGSFTGEIEKKSIDEFRKWWKELEKLNELDNVPWETVESEWAKATENQIGRNNKSMQKDITDIAVITRKHINEIAKIISDERPYDGIIENLRENLTKMDVLFADLGMVTKEQLAGDSLIKDMSHRLSFLLGEAENAYTLTANELMDDMRRAGFDSWVDALTNDDNGEELKRRLLVQLRTVYDAVQEATKKESSQIKKETDIWWADVPTGQDQSRKYGYENLLGRLGLEEEQIKRANQLIGAGYASDNVSNKLAIKQMQLRLNMQQTYYNKMREIGLEHINQLQEEANLLRKQGKYEEAQWKQFDADHLRRALNIAKAEEGKKLLDEQNAITLATEESQNRLYTYLKEWGVLMKDSIQGIFESTHAGEEEYYNERAKLNLTGKGGPGAGTYVVIDNDGTSNAAAHYEYLDEREALERKLEVERENAMADAWKKVLDDFNMKLDEFIVDYINSILQNASLDSNTQELIKNTAALTAKTAADAGNIKEILPDKPKPIVEIGDIDGVMDGSGTKFTIKGTENVTENQNTEATKQNTEELKQLPKKFSEAISSYIATVDNAIPEIDPNNPDTWPRAMRKRAGLPINENPHDHTVDSGITDPTIDTQTQIDAESKLTDAVIQNEQLRAQAKIDADTSVTNAKIANNERLKANEIDVSNEKKDIVVNNSKVATNTQTNNDKKTARISKETFAAMTAAANMYGTAYQAMSNDNLSTAQKVEMMIVQIAGQALISLLTAQLAADTGETASHAPSWVSKTLSELGPVGGPVAVGVLSALIGGLLGLATSKIGKSKSQIAQVTGASSSAGRLSTGMLTYAKGNVNEFTDPSILTPGRKYNVDSADGRTYMARYMGSNPRTHITNGPEFHLAGERGREMIIDAGTTRQITMNENEIWRAIQTLSGGGSLRHVIKRGRGVSTYASGNVSDFSGYSDYSDYYDGVSINPEQVTALQVSINRQNELLERALSEGIRGVFNVHGPDGLVANYDRGKKNAKRHGERY